MENRMLGILRQVADGIADQFGSNCEVAIHDPYEKDGGSVAYIVNEHVSGQMAGSYTDRTLLKQGNLSELESRGRICYMVKTPDGSLKTIPMIYTRKRRDYVSRYTMILEKTSR